MCGNGCATAYRNWWKPPPLPASLFLSKILNKLLKSIKTHKSEHNTGNRRTRFTTRREILKENSFKIIRFSPHFSFVFIFFLAIIELQLTLVCAPHYSLLFYYFVYFSLLKNSLIGAAVERVDYYCACVVCVCNIEVMKQQFSFSKKKPL